MTPSHPLTRPFERNVRAFGEQLPTAADGAVEPLHQCRVATRRLREILPLCAAETSRSTAGRARRRLRRVGRALGPVREVDVALALVDALARRRFVRGQAEDHLRRRLLDEREERREQMLDRLRSVNTRKLERDLAEVARMLGMRRQTDAWAQALAARMNRRAGSLRDAVEAAGPLYVADRVHAVRIAAKQLRYALEFAAATGEARTKNLVRQVKNVQETLGRLHDLDVLAALAQDLIAPAARQPWRGDLERLRLRLEGECRKLHGRYVAKQGLLLDLCGAASKAAGRMLAERGGGPADERRAKAGGRVLKMRMAITPPPTTAATSVTATRTSIAVKAGRSRNSRGHPDASGTGA